MARYRPFLCVMIPWSAFVLITLRCRITADKTESIRAQDVDRRTTYQKLFGEYLFATNRIATVESSSVGYTPYEQLG